MIALVAAMDEARLIGVGGRLPWSLPADLRHFRALTMGHVVVMGRRTMQSIGARLSGRVNVALTRNGGTPVEQADVTAASLDRALRYFAMRDVFILGGASVFAEALPLADRLYLTRIAHTFPVGEGAVYFPAWSGFRLTASVVRAPDEENPYSMDFQTWERA